MIFTSITVAILLVTAIKLTRMRSTFLEFFAAIGTLTFFILVISDIFIKPLYHQGYVAPEKFAK